MSDDETYIIRPKDPDAIVKLQDPTVIEQLMEQPFAVISEVVTGFFASGNGYLATAGCRIVQGAFKGVMFQQLARELDDLRVAGKIPEDFSRNKNGYKSWVELLTILDEESPDEERLAALKAMFYAINKVGIQDQERILNYQLFQTAKRLTSGELLLMKAVFEEYKTGRHANVGSSSLSNWAALMANKLRHGLSALIVRDQLVLEQQGLIAPSTGAPLSQVVPSVNCRITDMGIRFCETLQSYQMVETEHT